MLAQKLAALRSTPSGSSSRGRSSSSASVSALDWKSGRSGTAAAAIASPSVSGLSRSSSSSTVSGSILRNTSSCTAAPPTAPAEDAVQRRRTKYSSFADSEEFGLRRPPADVVRREAKMSKGTLLVEEDPDLLEDLDELLRDALKPVGRAAPAAQSRAGRYRFEPPVSLQLVEEEPGLSSPAGRKAVMGGRSPLSQPSSSPPSSPTAKEQIATEFISSSSRATASGAADALDSLRPQRQASGMRRASSSGK